MNEIGANNSRARMSANETGPGLLHSRPNYIGEEFVKLQVKFGYNNIAGMTKKLTLKQTTRVRLLCSGLLLAAAAAASSSEQPAAAPNGSSSRKQPARVQPNTVKTGSRPFYCCGSSTRQDGIKKKERKKEKKEGKEAKAGALRPQAKREGHSRGVSARSTERAKARMSDEPVTGAGWETMASRSSLAAAGFKEEGSCGGGCCRWWW